MKKKRKTNKTNVPRREIKVLSSNVDTNYVAGIIRADENKGRKGGGKTKGRSDAL